MAFRSMTLVVAATACLTAGAALAAVDAAATVHARQANFKTIGRSMKAIADALKSPSPSLADIGANAKRIDDLAPQLPSWFPAGSGPNSGVKTAAKPDIWARPDDFHKDAAALAVAAHALDTAAAGGNLTAVRTDFAQLGDACKACHQSFRVRER